MMRTLARSTAILLFGGLLLAPAAQAQAPGPASEAAAAAAALYQAGDWAAAAEAYRKVVDADPSDGLAWLRLGRALIETGREGDALEAFDRVPETGLQTPFLHVFRARALVRLDRADEALAALERIQPMPAMGGGGTLTGIAEFAPLAENSRFQAVVEAVEAAALPCRDDPVSRQFDFWVGTWDVYVGETQVGTNTIEPMLGGCVLQENWTNAGGRQGKSFNWVDRSSGAEPRWRQMWVDDSGNTLDYHHGTFADGMMRFRGETVSAQGETVPQRLTFHAIHADTVRQVMEQSNDGGETWVVTFNGLYVRRR